MREEGWEVFVSLSAHAVSSLHPMHRFQGKCFLLPEMHSWGRGAGRHPLPLRDIDERHVQEMHALEYVVLGSSFALCGRLHEGCAEGQEGRGGGGGWPAQGHKAPAHCHHPIPPVLQPEGLGRAHLGDKSDFCRETQRGSGAPCSQQGWPWLSNHSQGQSEVAKSMRCQPRLPLPLPGSSRARRSFLCTSSPTRPSMMSKTVSPWASSST